MAFYTSYTNKRFAYEEIRRIKVKLDGVFVGTIREVQMPVQSASPIAFQYFPKGSRYGGAFFETLDDCKRAMESN